MTPGESAPAMQHAIQLAITPVFLLIGISALLGVMTNRLARTIDRGRKLEQKWPDLHGVALAEARIEIAILERRRRLANWAINFCTCAALLVCAVIIILFADEFLNADLKWLSGGLFVVVMGLLVSGLSCFLREVYLATHTGHIDASRFKR
jgi:hypothetical protein